MAFQFGTNWSVLSERTGSIQGPLLGYEAFTAFLLEATFFGVVLLGRDRAPPWFYFLSCCMVSVGTMLSSFWILANNSWMQVPFGHAVVDGKWVPDDWWAITTGPIMWVRWPHMLLAAFPTTGMSVVATAAWYLLRGVHRVEARLTLDWGLAAVARASTLGRLRPAANEGRGDAIPDNRRCGNLASGLYRGLCVIYAFLLYIYRLLRDGLRDDSASFRGATPRRPLAGAMQAEAGNRE